jgi:hypothetical protein
MIDLIITLVITTVMGIGVYIQAVMEEEKRKGKRIPLIWEKDFWK